MFALPTIIESLIISKDFKFPSLDKNFKQCLVGVYDAFKEILQSKFNTTHLVVFFMKIKLSFFKTIF